MPRTQVENITSLIFFNFGFAGAMEPCQDSVLGLLLDEVTKSKQFYTFILTFSLPGKDVWCDDKSDSNKLAKDGKCQTKVKPCVGTLIRPLPGKCQSFEEYQDTYEDFDYESKCQMSNDHEEDCEGYVYYKDNYKDFDSESICDNGTEICVEENSPSKCDRHPQCEDGEDERGCEEEYIRKGFFKKTETFRCNLTYTFPNFPTSPNWTLYTHRAFRCDGDPTCPYGEDEEDCQILAKTIKFIVRK